MIGTVDGESCTVGVNAVDDCVQGELDWISSIETDYDTDGCQDNSEDTDNDNDGVSNESDDESENEFRCSDTDEDSCEDCLFRQL